MDRRFFLRASVSGAGAIVLAAHPAVRLGASMAAAGSSAVFNAYLEITEDGQLHITCPQAEMGQSVHDGLSKILADELEADWSKVSVRLAMADDAYINPITRRHRTASSESIKIYFDLLRRLGAGAREMLVAAGAGLLLFRF